MPFRHCELTFHAVDEGFAERDGKTRLNVVGILTLTGGLLKQLVGNVVARDVHKRFVRWANSGAWERVFHELLRDKNVRWLRSFSRIAVNRR